MRVPSPTPLPPTEHSLWLAPPAGPTQPSTPWPIPPGAPGHTRVSAEGTATPSCSCGSGSSCRLHPPWGSLSWCCHAPEARICRVALAGRLGGLEHRPKASRSWVQFSVRPVREAADGCFSLASVFPPLKAARKRAQVGKISNSQCLPSRPRSCRQGWVLLAAVRAAPSAPLSWLPFSGDVAASPVSALPPSPRPVPLFLTSYGSGHWMGAHPDPG